MGGWDDQPQRAHFVETPQRGVSRAGSCERRAQAGGEQVHSIDHRGLLVGFPSGDATSIFRLQTRSKEERGDFDLLPRQKVWNPRRKNSKNPCPPSRKAVIVSPDLEKDLNGR